MVLHAIKEHFRCAETFLLRTGRFFLLFSSKIKTSCQQNKQSSDKLPCGTKFLRVLIFAIFPAIRNNVRVISGISDHDIVLFEVNLALRKEKPVKREGLHKEERR